MKSVRPIWVTNIFEGTSFMKYDGIAFVLKLFSYLTLGLLTAAFAFVIHLVKVIYYSIEIAKHP